MYRCPQCGSWARAQQTRKNKDTGEVKRRYRCSSFACWHKFSTIERLDTRGAGNVLTQAQVRALQLR